MRVCVCVHMCVCLISRNPDRGWTLHVYVCELTHMSTCVFVWGKRPAKERVSDLRRHRANCMWGPGGGGGCQDRECQASLSPPLDMWRTERYVWNWLMAQRSTSSKYTHTHTLPKSASFYNLNECQPSFIGVVYCSLSGKACWTCVRTESRCVSTTSAPHQRLNGAL